MICATCHLDREHAAKGLCESCYSKSRYWSNLDREHARNRKYYQLNKERVLARHKTYKVMYEKKRRSQDINYRITFNLRARISKAVRRDQKVGSAVQDLGCSIPHFKLYIENQFQDGMTWDNYGKWHLDHVMPLASFDLTDRTQFLEASNWLNYQPLWAVDNIGKRDRI